MASPFESHIEFSSISGCGLERISSRVVVRPLSVSSQALPDKCETFYYSLESAWRK